MQLCLVLHPARSPSAPWLCPCMQWQDNPIVIALDWDCKDEETSNCEPGAAQLISMALQTACMVVYVALYFYYQARAFRDHRWLPACLPACLAGWLAAISEQYRAPGARCSSPAGLRSLQCSFCRSLPYVHYRITSLYIRVQVSRAPPVEPLPTAPW